MKRFVLAMFALSGLVGVGIWITASRPGSAPPGPMVPLAQRPAPPQEIQFVTPSPRPSPPRPAPDEAAPLPALLIDGEQATRRIQVLSSTFDPQQVQELALYLGHPVRDIRKRAARGLMLLGSDAAVPALVIAAQQAEAEQDEGAALVFQGAVELLSNPRPDEPKPAPKSLDAAERDIAEMWRQESLKPLTEAKTSAEKG